MLTYVRGDQTLRNVTCLFRYFYLDRVGINTGLNLGQEYILRFLKTSPFNNLKVEIVQLISSTVISLLEECLFFQRPVRRANINVPV